MSRSYELPAPLEKKLAKARRLEYITIFSMTGVVLLIYSVMGTSQAMKTAWMEDMLSLIPPISFLIADRLRGKKPDRTFLYGYHRVVNICFLVSALALLTMGFWLSLDGAINLIKGEHPTIGTMEIFGYVVWQGWLMIAALVISVIPPVILGRIKVPISEELHDKVLFTDANMNKADWMTGLAAALGITGIAFGLWWADAAAAIFISVDVLRDGWRDVKTSVTEIMDRVPQKVANGERDDLVDTLLEEVCSWDWIKEGGIRLREHGHIYFGEIYIVPKAEGADLVKKISKAVDKVRGLNWRLHDLTIMPVMDIPEGIIMKDNSST